MFSIATSHFLSFFCNSKSSGDYIGFISNKCHVLMFWQGLHFVCFVAGGGGVLDFLGFEIVHFCNE
jgi:hypothetical protein